jgi:hypothetical protein
VLDDHITRLAGDPLGEPATIEVSADGATASATLPCVVETETAIEGAGDTLIEMARAQGEGVLRRTERAVLETTCVKPGGTWKIVAARLRPA